MVTEVFISTGQKPNLHNKFSKQKGEVVKGETLREKSTKCNGGRAYLDPASIPSTALKMYERIRLSTN